MKFKSFIFLLSQGGGSDYDLFTKIYHESMYFLEICIPLNIFCFYPNLQTLFSKVTPFINTKTDSKYKEAKLCKIGLLYLSLE